MFVVVIVGWLALVAGMCAGVDWLARRIERRAIEQAEREWRGRP